MPNVPHPSETTSWPHWFYPPETTEADPAAHGRIFKSHEEVPEGWAADWRDHGVNLDREPPPAPPPGMTRAELKAELSARNVPFAATDAKAELQRLYDEALADEALENSV